MTLQITILITCLTLAVLLSAAGGGQVPEYSNSGVPKSREQVIVGMLAEASERAKAEILSPGGRTHGSREFRRARAAERLVQLDRYLAQYREAASRWAGEGVAEAYRAGKRLAVKQAAEVGVRAKGDVLQGSFSQVDLRMVQVFARDTAERLAAAGDSLRASTERLLYLQADLGVTNAEVNQLLAVGSIEGKPRETTRRLAELLRKSRGGDNLIEIPTRTGGTMTYEASHYAELVVRTKTREASVVARHETLQSLDLDLVAIVGRISPNFCTAYLRQVYSLSGKHPKYPPLARLPRGGPPFHPNCTKTTRPFVEDLASERQLRDADPIEPKMLGTEDRPLDPVEAQRRFQDLQVYTRVRGRFPSGDKTTAGEAATPRRAPTARDAKDSQPVRVGRVDSRGNISRTDQPSPTPVATAPAASGGSSRETSTRTKRGQTVEQIEARTAQMRAQADRSRAAAADADRARREATARADRLRAELASVVSTGNAAVSAARGGASEIAELRRRITAAESVVRDYERTVRRAERGEGRRR